MQPTARLEPPKNSSKNFHTKSTTTQNITQQKLKKTEQLRPGPPNNPLIEKEHHLNQNSIFGASKCEISGVKSTPNQQRCNFQPFPRFGSKVISVGGTDYVIMYLGEEVERWADERVVEGCGWWDLWQDYFKKLRKQFFLFFASWDCKVICLDSFLGWTWIFTCSSCQLESSITPRKFNIAPEKWCLEEYFPCGMVIFQELLLSPTWNFQGVSNFSEHWKICISQVYTTVECRDFY